MKKADYHVVNEIVEYAKQEKGKSRADFVNAILRRYLREQGTRSGIPEGALEHSFPQWLVKRWETRYGRAGAEKLLTALNETPQFALRVNLEKISISEAASLLRKEGIKTEEGTLSESALCVRKLGPVLKNKLFMESLISVQDEMSQLVGTAIGTQTNKRILDACAGLGTKTRQIQEICPGSVVVSMDNNIQRLKSIAGTGTTVLGDAVRSPFRKGVFDIILIDAPCSSLGIIRKHPEIKWRRRQQDIISFSNYQLTLLNALWDNLEEGGCLVYSVCSFEPEETTEVIAKFRKERRFRLENPLPFLFNKEYFLSVPHHTGADGFFIAKMKKI